MPYSIKDLEQAGRTINAGFEVSGSSSITVYANGFEVYSGAVSRAPNPIVYEKG